MFENEDAILPDDYQADLPQSDEVVDETPVDEVEDTNLTEETEEVTEGTPTEQLTEEQKAFLKVKYNKEEMDLDEDTARELAQKGLNYDKLQEKLQSLETDPRLSFVEELAKSEGMEVNEYLEAVSQHREQQRLNELIQQNIPEELAKEILESRKDRDSRKQQDEQKMQEEKQNAEFTEFFDYFKQANGRDFVAGKDEIPPTVWEAQSNGTPLRFAYMEHQNNELKSQLQVLIQNKSNEKKAPIGSVTSHGSTETASEDDFLKGFNSI